MYTITVDFVHVVQKCVCIIFCRVISQQHGGSGDLRYKVVLLLQYYIVIGDARYPMNYFIWYRVVMDDNHPNVHLGSPELPRLEEENIVITVCTRCLRK